MKVVFNRRYYPMLDYFFANEGKKDYSSDKRLMLTIDQWDALECAIENAFIEMEENGSSYFDCIGSAKRAYYEGAKNEIL